MIKKTFIGSVTAVSLLFTSVSVCAATIVSCRSGETALVTLTTDEALNMGCSLFVLKPGTELIPGNDGEIDGVVKFENITVEGNDGYKSVTYSFNTSEFEKGQYTVKVGGTAIGMMEGYIVVSSEEEAQEAVTELKGASSSSLEEIIRKYNGRVWHAEKADSEITGKIYEMLKSEQCDTAADAERIFDTAKALNDIEKAEKADMADKIKMYHSVFDAFPDITDEQIKDADFINALYYILHEKNGAVTVKMLEENIKTADALGKVNAADREKIISVINTYADVLGIDKTVYSGLDEYDMAKLVYRTEDLKSPEEISEALNSAAASIKASSSGGNRGGLGGGGTGGSSGSGIFGSGINVKPLDAEEIKSLVQDEKIFHDMEDAAWAVSYVDFLNAAGIISGDGNGYFRPNDPVTREEFVKLAVSAFKTDVPEATEIMFEDVQNDAWYAGYIKNAVYNKIITGVTDTMFGTGENITRQDAAVVLARTAKAKKAVPEKGSAEGHFADYDEISEYAKYSVFEMYNSGIISGYDDNTFRPKNNLTRAEAAKMIYGMLEKCGLM
ncbi:MAG: S-layer homology domain-containing protein [Clostridia bacterium]|nr:S-layer homology domain-containing protein [Clostridia bacterium]